MQFTQAVKFISVTTKSGISKKNGNPYEIKEAVFFIPDLGRVNVLVNGNPKFPESGTMVNIRLSVEIGAFSALRVVYDDASQFSVVK